MSAGTTISLIVGIAGIIFGIVTLFRNKKQDDTEAGKSSGTILSDIGYIKAGIDDIKT